MTARIGPNVTPHNKEHSQRPSFACVACCRQCEMPPVRSPSPERIPLTPLARPTALRVIDATPLHNAEFPANDFNSIEQHGRQNAVCEQGTPLRCLAMTALHFKSWTRFCCHSTPPVPAQTALSYPLHDAYGPRQAFSTTSFEATTYGWNARAFSTDGLCVPLFAKSMATDNRLEKAIRFRSA